MNTWVEAWLKPITGSNNDKGLSSLMTVSFGLQSRIKFFYRNSAKKATKVYINALASLLCAFVLQSVMLLFRVALPCVHWGQLLISQMTKSWMFYCDDILHCRCEAELNWENKTKTKIRTKEHVRSVLRQLMIWYDVIWTIADVLVCQIIS